ncbi:MAG: hypothetical protein LQ340_001369 [Diploschistes diacapsis]|nr:MAG: hypothetical protein LQ340_001369 [Diploschistes diacapsis]
MSYRWGRFNDPDRISRVRRTFQYPDDHDGNEPDNMDEQEQEALIKTLKQENDDQNELWIKYLPYLVGILSLLIGVNGMGWKDRIGVHDGFWILSWLPAVIFTMVIVARQVLVEVDPDELLNMQYDLKGA